MSVVSNGLRYFVFQHGRKIREFVFWWQVQHFFQENGINL